jgi:hypothetical protein
MEPRGQPEKISFGCRSGGCNSTSNRGNCSLTSKRINELSVNEYTREFVYLCTVAVWMDVFVWVYSAASEAAPVPSEQVVHISVHGCPFSTCRQLTGQHPVHQLRLHQSILCPAMQQANRESAS